jgi:hypothetical protein
MEHRWSPRVDATVPVFLRALLSRHEHSGQLSNLSLSGAWISVSVGLHHFERIQLVFELAELLGNSSQEVDAYVARRSAAGTGLEWCEHAPQAIVRLLSVLDRMRGATGASRPRISEADPRCCGAP